MMKGIARKLRTSTSHNNFKEKRKTQNTQKKSLKSNHDARKKHTKNIFSCWMQAELF